MSKAVTKIINQKRNLTLVCYKEGQSVVESALIDSGIAFKKGKKIKRTKVYYSLNISPRTQSKLDARIWMQSVLANARKTNSK